MAKASVMILLIVCINVFLYVGDLSYGWGSVNSDILKGFVSLPSDIDTQQVTINQRNNTGEYTNISATGNVPRDKISISSGTGAGDFDKGLLESTSFLWNMILFLWDMLTISLTFWYTIPGISFVAAFVISIPFAILYFMAIMSLWSKTEW